MRGHPTSQASLYHVHFLTGTSLPLTAVPLSCLFYSRENWAFEESSDLLKQDTKIDSWAKALNHMMLQCHPGGNQRGDGRRNARSNCSGGQKGNRDGVCVAREAVTRWWPVHRLSLGRASSFPRLPPGFCPRPARGSVRLPRGLHADSQAGLKWCELGFVQTGGWKLLTLTSGW